MAFLFMPVLFASVAVCMLCYECECARLIEHSLLFTKRAVEKHWDLGAIREKDRAAAIPESDGLRARPPISVEIRKSEFPQRSNIGPPPNFNKGWGRITLLSKET